jgi:nucleoside-diphosphate-sugar epimerase
MRVLITGATGFVGGALARALFHDGAEVHALVRSTSDRGALAGLPVQFHEGDVTSPETLPPALDGSSCVIHAAGRLGEAGIPEEAYRRVHVDGTRNLLQAVSSLGTTPRVLHISTPGVVGSTGATEASEDAPYAPNNPYERTKAAAERVALEFAAQGLPVVVARPGFMYGPGDRHVLKLFQAVQRGRFFYVDGGRHFCHPTYIADAVGGMLLCLQRGTVGAIYHITGPRPVTFRELGETLAQAMGARAPSLNLPRWLAMTGATALEAIGRVSGRKPPLSRAGVDFFAENRQHSSQKAQAELGYSPQYDLKAGVALTVAWYRERNWL